MSSGQKAYDDSASAEVQSNIERIASRLEELLGERDVDVNSAMSDFEADGVDESYREVEQKWGTCGNEVRSIIRLLRETMEKNDSTAQDTLSRANTAVSSI